MKQSKRVLAWILALVMVFSLLPVSVFADTVPTFSISSVNGHPGDEVEVKVSISNNPGMAVMNYEITYDTTRLERVSFTAYGMDGGVWSVGTENNKVLWDNTSNSTYNGDIMTLKFKIKADAPAGDAEISIKDFDNINEDFGVVVPTVAPGKVTVTPKPVTSISLKPTTLSLNQGDTGNLTATVEPADAGNKKVNWSSSNEKVATVDNGVVTAVGTGSATITAKAGDFEATCAVTVTGANVPVSGITLNKSSMNIMAESPVTLTATVTPDYATDKTVTWTSSNEAVATVADGVVTGVAAGSATITATAGGFSATCSVQVIDNYLTASADGKKVDILYIGENSQPNGHARFRIDVPAGTDTVVLSGPISGWQIIQGPAIVDGVISVDLNTYYGKTVEDMTAYFGVDYKPSAQWELEMLTKKTVNLYNEHYMVLINMLPCEGEHSFADATCTAPKTCAECRTTEGKALGHDLSQTAAEVPADCDTAGTTAVMACSRCDHTEGGTEIPALGHDWMSAGRIKEPTCTEAGSERFVCKKGDGATKDEAVAALGHTWNNGTVTTEPTCTEKGVKTFHCTVCEDGTKTEEIPANGHSYVDGNCSVCEKMEPTLIPFTKANHTDSGDAIDSKFTGIVGLEVDGVTLTDWSEWVQGGNYQTQSITIYVAAEDKDKAATFTLLLADGQTASGALINKTATVQLNSGVGSYSASGMVIGTGGMAPRLNLNITFKHELCEEHTWVDANCTTPKTCSVCAATEGDVRPHVFENGVCKYEDCGVSLPFTIKAGETTLTPVQIDVVNCTKAGKNVATFDLTVPAGTTSLDFSGVNKFNLLNGETHKSLGSNKTSYSYSLSNGCITACYYDRTTKIYYHINILHVWNDATCTDPKTCANCGATDGEALGHRWDPVTSTCTVEGCGAANVITAIEVSHPSIEKNEETGVMTMAMVAGGREKIDVSFGLVDAAVASTQVVAWFVATEETDADGNPKDPATIATVTDGVVTAVGPGTVTITAKAVDASGIALLADGEEVMAQFTLTVADPEEGYTVTMGDDVMNTVIGSNVSIPVTIGHTGVVTKYNAFDLSFSYDPAVLELTSTSIEGMTVDYLDENQQPTGNVHIERYGDDLTAGQHAFTLTFKAIATGETKVEVTSAKVDISESALTKDAPDASVIDELTRVSVTGYTVNLPAEFTGASSVMPGVNYTFTPKNENYTYKVTATIDGKEIPATANDNGSFTISAEDITGNIVITVNEETGKVFNVTRGEDMTGLETAQYMTDYTATLTKASGSNYRVTVTIGGTNYTGFSAVENEDGTVSYTIPGEAITGEIVFNSNKTEKTQDKHSVQFKGEYGDIADNTAVEVENGTDYVLTINKLLGYKYTVTATMGGEAATVTDNGNGTYTVANVTGDLVFTITKESDLVVDVKSYVTLNGKQMFLVTATASVDTGKVLSYKDNEDNAIMFFSKQYADPEVEGETGKWVYLVLTDGTLSADDAKAKITLTTGTKVELSQTYNVNETPNESVDINDAQLVYDMYNNKYQTIEEVTMQKFLKADVNGDMKIDVNDAVAVVETILKTK